MAAPCASIISCVGNQTTRNCTMALASANMESSTEYTSAVATRPTSQINQSPLLSTTASVAARRMLTRSLDAATQELRHAIAGFNMNVKFAIGSNVVGALLNVTSANLTESLTAQVQTMFAGIATVTVITGSNATAWFLSIWYEGYYGPPPALTIYGSHNASRST
ncbi:hypothetical protein SDRG_09072 [Saprolegnia diclina VS20]|uniref:Uncharacterized protein n=1 Tax=Saprolegnia diclina (strain VS20) TaxID=1156394 RepID=T0QFS1_SAPDV|nr:hypothetical protein SDRG_09072 [Saprolegnia diclina VS20]EQC33566.1 hypothetical protein SDRG_09072 [Saprolegnia diclina VS20]|eukprot:XP_008613206.1 hypothetical protein SDRG_09072 [Saprolegnia diclina VS20]